ncbi:MAG TPA: type IV toxin-antitoxin system AbiEi family antitoxin domain-containing protein [Smithellaceae bacterium]|nr:type IV toxin-antitoxin system AbiEi family antitoxin domain-containing protein [Smithellaceae bacterium]HRV43697.1 type IV toxin-antitoxin system AbiEi family antitoxin domain-containing protein [Smithellaceae bacterium]
MDRLQILGRKDYFTLRDAAQAFGLAPASARVLCSRYVRKGQIIRLKNNFYITAWHWENLKRLDLFRIANVLQVPSYLSLMTALAYHDVTTQAQQDYVESVCLKRTVTYTVRGIVFQYTKIAERSYGGFVRKDGLFIATAEKALLDAAYLYSFGKYKFDRDSLDFSKLDMKTLKSLMKHYPQKTKDTVNRICGT